MGVTEYGLELEEIAQNFFSCVKVMDDRKDIIAYNDDQLCEHLESHIDVDSGIDFWIETTVEDDHHLKSVITFQFGEFEKATFQTIEIIIKVPFIIPK